MTDRVSGVLIARTFKRIGSIPATLAMACCDLGEAVLEDGSVVTITWGRNINADEQRWYLTKTTFKPVWLNTADGSTELIIPDNDAKQLRSILTPL
jgi:hypothetical protein